MKYSKIEDLIGEAKKGKMFILVEPGRIEIDKIYSIENNSTWSQFQQKEYNFIFWIHTAI